jgi:hypothetical protein
MTVCPPEVSKFGSRINQRFSIKPFPELPVRFRFVNFNSILGAKSGVRSNVIDQRGAQSTRPLRSVVAIE